MNFELPSTGSEQPPAFVDSTTCQQWLETIPLANAVQAQSLLLRQLTLLHRYTLPTADRYGILEVLRRPLADVQEDAAAKFAGKPLPLAPHEQAAMDTTLNLWNQLALGYLRCFDECCGGATPGLDRSAMRAQCTGNPELAVKAATLGERIFAVCADWQIDMNRGAMLPEKAYWQQMHQVFAALEALGLAGRAINDMVRHGGSHTSALAAYAECCLLAMANVYELPARHLGWVARWARRWGAKLALLQAPPEDIRNRAVPLWVDLASDRPPSYLPMSADGGRWLETTELRKSLIARITLLEQGRAPADLQLGDDVTQPAAGQLLMRVLQRWCKGGAERRQERIPANSDCAVVVGMEAIHVQLSGGQVFHAPTRSDSELRREREAFETFGERSSKLAKDDRSNEKLEIWHLLDQSAGGMRATRTLKDGARIGPGILVATKPSDAKHFVLGNVRWILREGDAALVAGMQLFPGEAKPVTVRTVDAGAPPASWRQGFLLPEIKAIKESASVILPAGTFRINRIVELMVDQKPRSLKLFRVLDRGIDFERCNFYD